MLQEHSQQSIDQLSQNNPQLSSLFDHQKLKQPINELKEKEELIQSFIYLKGLVKHHIDSFNQFLDEDIQKIIKAKSNNRILSDIDAQFYLQYNNIRVGVPTIEENFEQFRLIPQDCRMRDLNYSANIYVNIEYMLNNKLFVKNDIVIGKMPIMLGSSHCHLYQKKADELQRLKECPYDPKGYFIIRGVEKVALIQEQMAKNRIIIERDSKTKQILASVASDTLDTKSRLEVRVKNHKVYCKSNSFMELVPIFIMFKAMGIENEQQIFELIGTESDFQEYLSLSIEDCYKLNIQNQTDALEWIGARLRLHKYSGNKKKQNIEEGREVLTNIILAHIQCKKYDLSHKVIYLAIMVRGVLEAQKDESKLDDKDYYGNKRLECAGQLLSLLFEDKLKVFNSELKKQIDKMLLKNKQQMVDISSFMRGNDLITNGISNAISSGNWSIKRFKMERQGVTQVLSRLTYIGALGMMTRISSQIEKTMKISGPRALQGSHWGIICPTDTPDGESCGLVKNLALLTYITTQSNQSKIYQLSKYLGMEDVLMIGRINVVQNYIVLLNGIIIGVVRNGDRFVDEFRQLRRKNMVDQFISISIQKQKKQISIGSDSGRLTRPLLIVQNRRLLITQQDIELLKQNEKIFDDLVKEGKIEYLDVNEMDNSLIAMNEQQLVTNDYSHMEIDVYSILGCVAGLIPYPHHNQSPRNTYQCAMGKQSVGTVGYNQLNRFDTVLYTMIYPQQPLVRTKTIQLVKYDKLPAGHNASVCVMSYSGYDIEDAVILNRQSIQRGYGKVSIYKNQTTTFNINPNQVIDGLQRPIRMEEVNQFNKNQHKRQRILDEDGLSKIGSQINNGEIYINKVVPIVNQQQMQQNQNRLNNEQIEWMEQPVSFKTPNPNPTYVDRQLITSNQENPRIVKTIFRQTRNIEIGDKQSSRHGQKGVCGLIVDQSDMPFNEKGMNPDLIMNPHGFPSRMTVGKLIELIAGKVGALSGQFKDGTAFKGDKLKDCCKQLVKYGYNYEGKDCLISGISGEYIETYIFSGPIYYQRLKHMVADKIHARSRGPTSNLTRQPTEGRARDGGLRLGEMERDCLISYGGVNLLIERLMLASDLCQVYVCDKCGQFNHSSRCSVCEANQKAYQITLPYACKLLIQELFSMGIKTKINLQKV